MATFFSNQTIWYWGSTAYPVKGTLTGNVSRSGNTVTLSGMSLALSWPAYASGTWSVSFTVNGTTTSRSMAANTATFAVNSTSFSVGTSDTSRSVSWSSSDGYSGSFTVTFPSGSTRPSGPYVNWVSHTWNSITTTVGVSSWGSGTASTRRLQHIICTSSATASNWDTDSMARRVRIIATQNISSTAAVTNAYDDWHPSAGPVNIRGCLAYKIATWATTDVGDAGNGGFNNTIRYTPPAPLQTLALSSQSYAGANKANVVISITGGNSTNNNNVTVTTQYRTNINNQGWEAWTNAGTGTPWTTKTATINVACGASLQIQARQVYQSQASETKSLTVSVMKTPVRTYVPVNGKSKLARKAYISVNGEARKVAKIYKSVNEVSKLVYTG